MTGILWALLKEEDIDWLEWKAFALKGLWLFPYFKYTCILLSETLSKSWADYQNDDFAMITYFIPMTRKACLLFSAMICEHSVTQSTYISISYPGYIISQHISVTNEIDIFVAPVLTVLIAMMMQTVHQIDLVNPFIMSLVKFWSCPVGDPLLWYENISGCTPFSFWKMTGTTLAHI